MGLWDSILSDFTRMERRKRNGLIVRIGVLSATLYAAIIVYATDAVNLSEISDESEKILLIISGVLVAMLVGFTRDLGASVNFGIRDDDQRERQITSEADEIERRVRTDLLANVGLTVEKILSGDHLVTRLVDAKLNDGVVVALDEAMRKRTEKDAKAIRMIDHLDLVVSNLNTRLEGPAGRAETAANWSRNMAYGLAVGGLLVAVVRVYTMGDFSTHIIELMKASGDRWIWPIIAAQAAPWIGLILLIEFTALLFLRFYNRSIELQRYFTREMAILRNRYVGMRAIIEFGSPEQVVATAAGLTAHVPNDMEQQSSAEEVSATSQLTENLTSFVKEAASKVSGK